jgi:trimethylamine--corrinoid protein Co-methyltransferase
MAGKEAGADSNRGGCFGFKVFTDDQVRTLHQATLDVLQDVGIKVESEEALEIFHGAGAKVERLQEQGVVKFPSDLIEACIRAAPSRIVYYGRDPKDDYAVESGKVGFTTFGECVQIIDPGTRQVRSTNKDDLGKISRVCDRLEEIVVLERPVGAVEQFAPTQPLHNYEAMVSNTSKHIFLGFYSAENAKRIAQMAAACVGGMETLRKRPIVTAFVCPTSPLVLVKMCCDVVIACARLGIGVSPISMVLAGATSPATLAGSVVVHNAEVLAAIALAQLTVKGTPCTYASCSTIMDLRFGIPATGAPEHGMMSAGLAELAQYYELPCWMGGGLSDSKLPDSQAAHEFALTGTVAALSGANFVYGAGALESGLTFDYAKLIMDCEQIRRIQHLQRGIPVNDETLALDIIKGVGPGGEYLTHQHTLENMRALSRSDLFDRRSRSAWINKTGGKDLTERAYEKAAHILATHEPLPLLDGAAAAMRAIIAEYEAELKRQDASGAETGSK